MMVMPPNKPLVFEGESCDYFDRLIEDVAPHFDKHGVDLDFSGYDELKELTKECQSTDIELSLKIATAFNAWEEYFVECLAVTQKLLLDSETTKQEVRAKVSISRDPVKVANGDRQADCSEELVHARKERNAFLTMNDFLKNKIKSTQNGYYLWKKVYEIQSQLELIRMKNDPRGSGGRVYSPNNHEIKQHLMQG